MYLEQMRMTLRELGKLSAVTINFEAPEGLLSVYRAWRARSMFIDAGQHS